MLADELAGSVHALALHTYTESEWRERFGAAPMSPPCFGGGARTRPMNVATFYRFVALDDPHAVAARAHDLATQHALRGTILLAREGINATLTGDAVALFVEQLERDPRLAHLTVRFSRGDPDNPIFYRLKVKVRSELIAMQVRGTSIRRAAPACTSTPRRGINCSTTPDVTVIDARNRYEIALGTFPGAVDPGTRSFREFPAFAETLDPARQRRVALFCTGGIRCEKASALLLERGFDEVYQLDGGILNYLACVGADNRFSGECFVFDQRVSVNDDLNQGDYAVCHACRHPLTEADTASSDYVLDISCAYCVGAQTEQQRAAFAERARQSRLAAARGERHVGAKMHAAIANERRGRR